MGPGASGHRRDRPTGRPHARDRGLPRSRRRDRAAADHRLRAPAGCRCGGARPSRPGRIRPGGSRGRSQGRAAPLRPGDRSVRRSRAGRERRSVGRGLGARSATPAPARCSARRPASTRTPPTRASSSNGVAESSSGRPARDTGSSSRRRSDERSPRWRATPPGSDYRAVTKAATSAISCSLRRSPNAGIAPRPPVDQRGDLVGGKPGRRRAPGRPDLSNRPARTCDNRSTRRSRRPRPRPRGRPRQSSRCRMTFRRRHGDRLATPPDSRPTRYPPRPTPRASDERGEHEHGLGGRRRPGLPHGWNRDAAFVECRRPGLAAQRLRDVPEEEELAEREHDRRTERDARQRVVLLGRTDQRRGAPSRPCASQMK